LLNKLFNYFKTKKEEPSNRKYGWFSHKQLKANGGEYWVFSDINGLPTRVTKFTTKPAHDTKWDDIKFMGELKEQLEHCIGNRNPLYFGLSDKNIQDIRKHAK